MRPEEFDARMAEILADDDTERAHSRADRLLCDVLGEHGYSDGVGRFLKADLWRA